MATQVPSLHIVAGNGGEVDVVIDLPAGFDQVLGRDASADVTLADPAISRRHARLYRLADGVWLEDLGSTNGTYINGDRLTVPYRLRDGDEVKLGNSLATFHEVVSSPDATQVITTLDGPAPAGAPRDTVADKQPAPLVAPADLRGGRAVAGPGPRGEPAAAAVDTVGVPDVAGAGPPAEAVVAATTGRQAGPQIDTDVRQVASGVEGGARHAAPVITPVVTPQAARVAAPVASAQAAPVVTPVGSPAVAPDRTPAVSPAAAPDRTPTASPQAGPGPAPAPGPQAGAGPAWAASPRPAPALSGAGYDGGPEVAVADPQIPVTGSACPDCSTTNRSEAWFCSRCGRQLHAIPFSGGEPGPARARSRPLMTVHGEFRRQEFHQAMRAGNGGRRVPYNESLALPTIVFRGFLVVLLVALAVFGLVILNEGVHRVFGL
jgi:hypothetical protein